MYSAIQVNRFASRSCRCEEVVLQGCTRSCVMQSYLDIVSLLAMQGTISRCTSWENPRRNARVDNNDVSESIRGVNNLVVVDHQMRIYKCAEVPLSIHLTRFFSQISLQSTQPLSNMRLLLLSTVLPSALAAVLQSRQSSSVTAFNGWSAPDQTYDGTRILGSFDSDDNVNSSSPGVTETDYSGATQQSSRHLNITVQNLVPSLSIRDIFVAVHSDNVALFEVGKPVSDEISSFVSDGSSDAFSSLSSGSVYGTTVANNGSSSQSSLAPGQYLNFSVPLSLPSRVSNEKLADALDDLDASLTVIGRLEGLSQTFFAVDGSDLGDRRESATATVYSVAAGFLTVHSGYVNSSVTFAATSAAQVLTFAG